MLSARIGFEDNSDSLYNSWVCGFYVNLVKPFADSSGEPE